jgi:precorrin-4/cobalt-precorrin-4 C11-methyltransferase
MPAAVVYKASWEDEKRFICSVGTLAETVEKEGIRGLAVILIGRSLEQLGDNMEYERSRLYDPSFSTGYRKGTDN